MIADVFSRRRRLELAFILTLLASFGCAHHPGKSDKAEDQPLPTHFTGTLPCQDCGAGTGIDYDLMLSDSHTYLLAQDYDAQDKHTNMVETGRWHLDTKRNELTLTPADTDDTFVTNWRVNDDRTRLIALNEDHQPVSTKSRYVLKHSDELTNRELTGTHWNLLDTPGKPASKPAYIQLNDSNNRVTGYTSCNQLMAYFIHSDQALRIDQVSMTRRACAEGQANIEQAMGRALRHARHYETLGDFLLLYGTQQDPSPLAIFRAREN